MKFVSGSVHFVSAYKKPANFPFTSRAIKSEDVTTFGTGHEENYGGGAVITAPWRVPAST